MGLDGCMALMGTSRLHWWFSGLGSWLVCMVSSCPYANYVITEFCWGRRLRICVLCELVWGLLPVPFKIQWDCVVGQPLCDLYYTMRCGLQLSICNQLWLQQLEMENKTGFGGAISPLTFIQYHNPHKFKPWYHCIQMLHQKKYSCDQANIFFPLRLSFCHYRV